MQIETDTVVTKLSGGRSAPIGPLTSALMQACMVQIGIIGRTYLNNGRAPPGGPIPTYQKVLGFACYGAAVGMWAVTTWSVLDHLGPLDAATYPDASDLAEATALYVLAWGQIIYPLTFAIDFVWMHTLGKTYDHNEFSPRLSTLKDVRIPAPRSTQTLS